MAEKAGNISLARAGGTSPGACPCSGNPPAIPLKSENSAPHGESVADVSARLAEAGFWDAGSPGALYIIERVGRHLEPYLRTSAQLSPEYGMSVKAAHDILTFDRDLTAAIFKHIGVFEWQMRSGYARLMAEAYGPFAVYDASLFLRKENHARTMASFEAEVSKRLSRDRSAAEEVAANGGRLTTWGAVRCMTLGTLCHFYSNTADRSVTGAVAASFGATKDELVNWSKTITQVRNICAHFEPYVIRKQIPSTPKALKDASCPRRSPLFVILLLERLLGASEADRAEIGLDYCTRLKADIYDVISWFERFYGGAVPIAGFPQNWRTALEIDPAEIGRARSAARMFPFEARMHGAIMIP